MKPDIYFFIMDEMRADVIGDDGDKTVQTPNLDNLIKDSVNFTNCFSSCPMCAPARVGLATGTYNLTNGTMDNAMAPLPDVSSLYGTLKDNGYKTYNYGRWHTNCSPQEFGIEEQINLPAKGDEKYISGFGISNKEVRKEAKYKKLEGEVPLVIHGERPASILPEELRDSVMTKRYIDDLESLANNDKPVFARLGYINPHTPYMPCKEYADMYAADDMKMNEALGAPLDNKPLIQQYFYRARGFDKLNFEDYKKAKASYYGLITHVDDRIGSIIKRMKELDIYDDALIVFTSDHGSMMGEHGFIEKWGHMYDPVSRVPLVIKFPENENAGREISDVVSLIDIMPSLLDYNSIDIPEKVQGISFMPLLSEDKEGIKRQEVFCEYYAGGLMDEPALMVRDNEWKLTWYRDQETLEDNLYRDHPLKYTELFNKDIIEGELYNIKEDPDELVNLFYDEQYKDVKIKYMKKLELHLEECKPMIDYKKMHQKHKDNIGGMAMYKLLQGNNMSLAMEAVKSKGSKYKGERE